MDAAREILEQIKQLREKIKVADKENKIIVAERRTTDSYFETAQEDLARNIELKSFNLEAGVSEFPMGPKVEIRLGEPGNELDESELSDEQKDQLAAIKRIMTPDLNV